MRLMLLAATLALTGCVIHTEHAGPTLHKSESFDLDKKADVVRAYLKMGAGTLRVSGGVSDKLARADFDYNVPSWQPEVDYNAGTLRVTTGAGESHLDLGSLALRRVEVEMGVGEVQMDLRGNPKHDYEVRIRG